LDERTPTDIDLEHKGIPFRVSSGSCSHFLILTIAAAVKTSDIDFTMAPPASKAESSPYYSMTSFSLMLPLAFFYTCTANLLLRLASATGIHSQPPQQIQLPAPSSSSSVPSKRRVAIITGCNTGIGFETARALVLDHNVHVIMACRSRDKALLAIEQIHAERASRVKAAKAKADSAEDWNATNTDKDTDIAKAVFVHPLDLSSFDSVKAFCAAVKQEYPAVDILVNNAGRNTHGESLSMSSHPDDPKKQIPLDLLFQSNFLGHFLLTCELMNSNVLVPNARIVNLSSVMHHFCGTLTGDSMPDTWESVDFWKQCATASCAPHETYSPSKLAAQLFTLELNRRYGKGKGSSGESRGIRSIAVNPGAV
jgi:NAD(P)-dependent dehydrogenase (short-subunit alcohol dehydrogenase family)